MATAKRAAPVLHNTRSPRYIVNRVSTLLFVSGEIDSSYAFAKRRLADELEMMQPDKDEAAN